MENQGNSRGKFTTILFIALTDDVSNIGMKKQALFLTFQNEAYTKTVTVDEYGKISNITIKEKNVIKFTRLKFVVWRFLLKCNFISVLPKFDVTLELPPYGISNRNLTGIKVISK